MTAPGLRWQGAIADLSADDRAALFDRSTSSDDRIRSGTAAIIQRVRQAGDAALREMAREFDGVTLDALEVPGQRCRQALEQLDPALRSSLERAAANITAVHEAFRPTVVEVSPEPGIVVGRRPDPLGRVGIYAPGGRAAYPSSVLMGALPARVAGVGEVILCSPPGPTGEPSDVVLAAAALASVDRVFALGGAGAIAAMAYGTASVPRVDRIVGPGNAWVAEAKLQVSGSVAIDSPAGPSELLVLADDSADLDTLVREMLAQAEHDPAAAVVAIVVGMGGEVLADRLLAAIAREPRAAVVQAALASRGAVLEAASMDEAITFANAWAAEHLLMVTRDMDAVLPQLRNAGTVFVGPSSSVAFGDYMTGANHVLPTGGLARCYSGLSTLDFYRWSTWQRVDPAAAARLAGPVGTFADSEGLPAHAAAARQWEAR
jgi:histidinol dehydrogenase